MKSVLKEPLLHFLLIGVGLFLLYGMKNDPAPANVGQIGRQPEEIIVSRADIDQLDRIFQQTWQRPPTSAEKKGLIDDFVRNEIYYREAQAIGLDRDDMVIKRRMRQQMEFIFEDIASQTEPTEDELLSFMQTHPDRYHLDPLVAFRHIYLGDFTTDAEAEENGRQILALLASGADPTTVGKVFLRGSEIALSPLWDITDIFGNTFVDHLQDLTPDTWEGPIRSPYGYHVIQITERRESRSPSLSEVRNAVRRDLIVERQLKLKDEAYAKLKQKYTVIVETSKVVATDLISKSEKRTLN